MATTSIDEKHLEGPHSRESPQQGIGLDLDEAHDFLSSHANTPAISDVEMRRLTRTVDWRIMPMLFGVYFIQALDKQLLNYAAVMGLPKELHLAGNDFSTLATALFVAVLVAEVPSAFILTKVPVAKWLSINAVLWGVVTACVAAARNLKTLLALRILLGIFEAAVQPCLALISAQYYRKDHQGPRFLLWGSAIGLDLIIGGLLSFAFQHVHHSALAGWKILFLWLGLLSVAFGFFIFWYLPDSPMQARFLSDQQKVALLRHVAANKTGVKDKRFRISQAVDFLRDPQIWLLTIITMLTTMSSGVTLSYSSQLIAGFGFNSKQAALLNIPSGAVTIVACFVLGWALNTRTPRCLVIAGSNLVVIIGAGLVGFAPKHNHAALLAGLWIVNVTSAILFAIYQWASANVAGGTKRTMTMALITAAFSAGSLIGPQTFRVKDKPEYRPAKIALIGTQAGCALMCCILGLYYWWENKRRDAKYGKDAVLALARMDSDGADVKIWENLTDVERTSFRYMP